jgi:hypothetical protein
MALDRDRDLRQASGVKGHVIRCLPQDRLPPLRVHAFRDDGTIRRKAFGRAPEDLANPRIVDLKLRDQFVTHSIAKVLK